MYTWRENPCCECQANNCSQQYNCAGHGGLKLLCCWRAVAAGGWSLQLLFPRAPYACTQLGNLSEVPVGMTSTNAVIVFGRKFGACESWKCSLISTLDSTERFQRQYHRIGLSSRISVLYEKASDEFLHEFLLHVCSSLLYLEHAAIHKSHERSIHSTYPGSTRA